MQRATAPEPHEITFEQMPCHLHSNITKDKAAPMGSSIALGWTANHCAPTRAPVVIWGQRDANVLSAWLDRMHFWNKVLRIFFRVAMTGTCSTWCLQGRNCSTPFPGDLAFSFICLRWRLCQRPSGDNELRYPLQYALNECSSRRLRRGNTDVDLIRLYDCLIFR